LAVWRLQTDFLAQLDRQTGANLIILCLLTAMQKIKNPILIVAALACLIAAKPKLVKTKINEEITVSIPAGWRPMDGIDFTERYPSVRAPLGAYTDEERMVDFAVNVSATQWPDKDAVVAHKFFKSSVVNMFDKVEFISDGVKEHQGNKYIYLEFTSRVNGNKRAEGLSDPVMKYTYVQYLLGKEKTLVFSFNCPKRMQQDWQPIAHDMMKAIKVKN
jgi:hypothetical protein